jgi:hypothetical protein
MRDAARDASQSAGLHVLEGNGTVAPVRFGGESVARAGLLRFLWKEARGCAQSSQPHESTGEMDEHQERLSQFVVAGGDGSEMFEASEETLDHIAIPIEPPESRQHAKRTKVLCQLPNAAGILPGTPSSQEPQHCFDK